MWPSSQKYFSDFSFSFLKKYKKFNSKLPKTPGESFFLKKERFFGIYIFQKKKL